MQLRDLIADAAARVPVIASERCVHMHAEVASCQRCVDACPLDAWTLDDDALYIDSARCDGCGLCAGQCPQGALVQAEAALPKWNVQRSMVASCERVRGDRSGLVIPCVNAIGLQQLAALYSAGLRRMDLQLGHCRHCSRRDGDAFRQRAALFTGVLEHRGLAPLVVSLQHTQGVSAAKQTTTPQDAQGQLSRRGFLRRMAGIAAASTSADAPPAWQPAGNYLPASSHGDRALAVPHIDAQRCNGCDACIRVCPHAALQLTRERDAYTVDASACTGCGLCSDVCDRNAVSVEIGGVVEQLAVALHRYRCAACGAPFHTPRVEAGERPLCRICVQVNHQRNLFQVL